MKTVKTLFATLVLFLVMGVSAQSQTKMKSPYPVFSISPVGGVAFPIGTFGDNFKTGPSFGLDLSYRVNKEVGFYAKFGYNIFSNKVTDLPKANYMEYTAGPRYFFTAKNLKSSIFVEAGVGGYTLTQDAYTLTSSGVSTTIPEVSSTDFGINAGIGATLNLGKTVDLIIKLKYHNVLTEGGSTSFISPLVGIDIRL
ncbi:MAG: outer membrane beta-barrel protein [Ignavibacteria bacterium]|nr:outer membrane beta-barrel protein [Ignavibacteria bacterium]